MLLVASVPVFTMFVLWFICVRWSRDTLTAGNSRLLCFFCILGRPVQKTVMLMCIMAILKIWNAALAWPKWIYVRRIKTFLQSCLIILVPMDRNFWRRRLNNLSESHGLSSFKPFYLLTDHGWYRLLACAPPREPGMIASISSRIINLGLLGKRCSCFFACCAERHKIDAQPSGEMTE